MLIQISISSFLYPVSCFSIRFFLYLCLGSFCPPNKIQYLFIFMSHFSLLWCFSLPYPEGTCQSVSIKHSDVFFSFGLSVDIVWLYQQIVIYIYIYNNDTYLPIVVLFIPNNISLFFSLTNLLLFFCTFFTSYIFPPSISPSSCLSQWAVGAWGGRSRAQVGTLRPYSISCWADTHTYTHRQAHTPQLVPAQTGPELIGWVLINFAASGEIGNTGREEEGEKRCR